MQKEREGFKRNEEERRWGRVEPCWGDSKGTLGSRCKTALFRFWGVPPLDLHGPGFKWATRGTIHTTSYTNKFGPEVYFTQIKAIPNVKEKILGLPTPNNYTHKLGPILIYNYKSF